MAAVTNAVSCNFPPTLLKSSLSPRKSLFASPQPSISLSLKPNRTGGYFNSLQLQLHMKLRMGDVQVRRSSLDTRNPETESIVSSEGGGGGEGEDEFLGGGDGSGGGGEERDWTTSFLLFGFWLGLMYYVFFLAPNQTPTTDVYFVKKLLFWIRDDGFEMNRVLVAVWNMMGIWPLVYSMLLIPTARSYKSKIPVWPFLLLSLFGGIYALLPYFVLWRPPSPPVAKSELKGRALKILDSKITAGIALAGGIGLMVYGLSAGGDGWKEFYQYFQASKITHITTIDFLLCSAFAPFWVYNDMTTRKWGDKGSWLIPVSAVPLLGPSIYLLLRPSLSSSRIASDDK
ncbi:uncharacterized protein LOC127265915 [Andrographis paniculata]|uniref:uncharacterized protein LOC127265915 n=1 Tax=Andrographis paniculata TaxID=175694 RepID=UPI0021E77B7C|nr:uncharacterized protein LOC127265915 [Andrographis paniculata]